MKESEPCSLVQEKVLGLAPWAWREQAEMFGFDR